MKHQEFRYQINQFSVTSAIRLPAHPRGLTQDAPDPQTVTIAQNTGFPGEVPEVHLLGRRGKTALRSYDVGSGVIIGVEAYAKLYVDRLGSCISALYDEKDELAAGIAVGCLVNLCMSVCTLLRGELALHGAGLEIAGRRVALVAFSGVGKSTLLWRMVEQGGLWANDDVVPVVLDAGRVFARSAGDLYAKVSADYLHRQDIDPGECQEVTPGSGEFWVPVPEAVRAAPKAPLEAIFVLQPRIGSGGVGEIEIHRASRSDAVMSMMTHTQGLWAVAPLIEGVSLLSLYREIAARVPVFVVRYTRSLSELTALAAKLESVVRSLMPNERMPGEIQAEPYAGGVGGARVGSAVPWSRVAQQGRW